MNTVPDVAEECRKQALGILPSIAPEERVVLFLSLIERPWPESGDKLWDWLEKDLRETDRFAWVVTASRIFAAAADIRGEKAARRAWTTIAAISLEPDDDPNNLWIGRVTLELARCSATDKAAAMLEVLRMRSGKEAWPFTESRAYGVAAAYALDDPAARAWLHELLDNTRAEHEKLNRLDTDRQFIRQPQPGFQRFGPMRILGENVPWLVTDKEILRKALDLYRAVADVDDRADALDALSMAALRHGEYALAVTLLSRIPVAGVRTQAVLDASVRLPLGVEGKSSAADCWREFIDVAQQDAGILTSCAARWAAHHVGRVGAAGAAAAVADLLEEFAFIKRQIV